MPGLTRPTSGARLRANDTHQSGTDEWVAGSSPAMVRFCDSAIAADYAAFGSTGSCCGGATDVPCPAACLFEIALIAAVTIVAK